LEVGRQKAEGVVRYYKIWINILKLEIIAKGWSYLSRSEAALAHKESRKTKKV
jgi:hypothetical protein